MSSCPSCLRAQQRPLQRDYDKECPGCGIRQLAHMTEEEREKQFDLLCHQRGPAARSRVRGEVRIELARIKQLRHALPKKGTPSW